MRFRGRSLSWSVLVLVAAAVVVGVVFDVGRGQAHATVARASRSVRSAFASGGSVPTAPTQAQIQKPPASLLGGSDGSAVFPSSHGSLVSRFSSAQADTYALKGGSFVTKVFAHPVNFKNASGDWAPIDNTLVADPSAGHGAVQNAANSWHSHFPASLASGPVTVDDGGHQFGFGVHGAASAALETSGPHATYHGAFAHADVSYDVQSEAVKEQIVLQSAQAPSSYSFDLSVPAGYTPKLEHGQVRFYDASGSEASVMVNAASVTDGSQTLGGPLGPLTESLDQRESGGWVLTVSVDQSWLDASDRTFPVTIDPSLTMNGPQGDCFIAQAFPNTSYCSNGYLDLGSYQGELYDDALYFGQIPLPKDAQVGAAAVALDFGSGSSDLPGVTAYPITNPWNSQATWNNTGRGIRGQAVSGRRRTPRRCRPRAAM